MKKYVSYLIIALFSGAITLGGYTLLIEQDTSKPDAQEIANLIPTSYNTPNFVNGTNIDFTAAAEKTVNAVAHVKNRTITSGPTNILEFLYGKSQPREVVGSGSGVVITADGYVVTNNHVIESAKEIEVILNDKSYAAELIGADPKTDIALLKIEADEDLPYVPFADSDEVRVGEWVLAVGNPFNLTSTVTAGIVSAKARNLREFDGNPQSFIQTDAAVNRGNSGGALVNVNGELVGINTAITSQTGAFIGYSFAVPSNLTKKVVEDILEYGNVQRAILGVQILNKDSQEAKELGVDEVQGVYVAETEKGSGADQAGIKEGDIIKKLDDVTITKFTELSGYLGTKRPGERISVTVERDGKERVLPVTLRKLETYEIATLGLEVKNTNEKELKELGAQHGVKITKPLTREMAQYDLAGGIITRLNDKDIKNIDDVKRVMQNQTGGQAVKMTFINREGETNTFIFR